MAPLRGATVVERPERCPRRSDVVGIYPNDEWLVQHRYLSLESLTALREAAQDGPSRPADAD
jgi:hypothetical protein